MGSSQCSMDVDIYMDFHVDMRNVDDTEAAVRKDACRKTVKMQANKQKRCLFELYIT